MSDWNDSEERLDVPYNNQRSFLLIENPCFVTNVDKAMQMHGGLKNIERIYNDTHKRLPVKFRPDDIYCKPAFADQHNTTKLLLKVKRRTRKDKQTVEFSAEILGPISNIYQFNAMVDFQYLPVMKTSDEKYESFDAKTVLNAVVDRKDYMNRDVPLFIPPLHFSRVDKPSDSLQKRAIAHREGYVNPDTKRPSNFIGTVRQRRSIYTIFVNFGEDVPTEPMGDSKKRLKAAFVDPEGEITLRKLFEEKPLWLKVELEHRTGYNSDKLKTYLPALSYYWLDGPWRAQWNRFGFDPTKDPSAKIYQTIDFRIRQLKPGQINIKAKRSEQNFSHWNQLSRSQQVPAVIDTATLGEQAHSTKAAHNKEIYYKFRSDWIPPQKMMYYPLNYVCIDEVQQMLHSNDGKEKTCDEKDGWCVSGMTDRGRDNMYSYTDRLLSRGTSQQAFIKKKSKKKKLKELTLEEDDDTSTSTSNLDPVSMTTDLMSNAPIASVSETIFGNVSQESADNSGAT